MKISLKNYMFLKAKTQVKRNKLLVFYTSNDFNSKIGFKMKKLLKNLQLKHYKLQNRIAKKVLHHSIYKKFKSLVNGLTLFSVFKVLPNQVFSTIFKIGNILTILGIKLNKTFYLLNQIKTITTLKYKKAIIELKQLLKTKIKSYYFEIM